MNILEKLGVLVENDHIVYTSGKHGATYFNKDAIYPTTKIISKLCRDLAQQVIDLNIEVVVAPAVGGVILSQWIAYHLTLLNKKDILAVYADKLGDGFILKRGYDKLVKGKRVLVVEDVIHTGKSVIATIKAVKEAKGKIVAVSAICNRSKLTKKDLKVQHFKYLFNVPIEAWNANECPLCKKGVPINKKIGHGGKIKI